MYITHIINALGCGHVPLTADREGRLPRTEKNLDSQLQVLQLLFKVRSI